MAKIAILSGKVIGKSVSADFKDGARCGEKFHIKLADTEKGRFTGTDGTQFEVSPVTFYDVKISKEQYLSNELKLHEDITIEAHEFVIKDNNGDKKEKTYYRAFDLEEDAQ